MKHNMGTADRFIRVLLAVVVGVFVFTGKLTGIAAVVLGVFAVVFLLTSFVGNCPAYTLLGISSCSCGHHEHKEDAAA